jgi:hypothetical protein
MIPILFIAGVFVLIGLIGYGIYYLCKDIPVDKYFDKD